MQLLLDVDGCILDFETPALAAAEHITGHKVSQEERVRGGWDILTCCKDYEKDKDAIHMAWQEPGFCLGLEPIPGALEFVKKLSGIGDIFLVTSHMLMSKTWVWEREQCLKKHGFLDVVEGIIHTHHKYAIAGDVIIDDRVSNVTKWLENQDSSYITGVVLDHYGYSKNESSEFIQKNRNSQFVYMPSFSSITEYFHV